MKSAGSGGSSRISVMVTRRFGATTALDGVDPKILNPRETWADKAAYDATARSLVDMFNKNFAKFEAHVDADVRAAAPVLKIAAE